MGYIKNCLLIVILGLGVFLMLDSCDKKQEDNSCGYVPVDITLYLNDPSNVKLNVVGGFIYLNGGVRGIVVYRRGPEEYVALERNCTYDCNNACSTIRMEASGSTLIDTCCGSRFQAYDGSVAKPPATRNLRLYTVTKGSNSLRITSN